MPHRPTNRARQTLDELGPIADAIEQFAEAIRDHVPSNESEKRVDMERLSLNPAGLSHVLTCAVQLEHVLGPLRPATKAAGPITSRFWPNPYRSSLRAALSAADRVFDRIVTRWNWQTAIGRHGFEGCAIGTDGHRYPDASQMSAPLEDLIVHATEVDMLRRSASQLHAMAQELGALDAPPPHRENQHT